jgi:hypothetical protein
MCSCAQLGPPGNPSSPGTSHYVFEEMLKELTSAQDIDNDVRIRPHHLLLNGPSRKKLPLPIVQVDPEGDNEDEIGADIPVTQDSL